MIELDRLCKRHGAVAAVESLSLRVARGELLVLLGASGSGKTTTLKMINRLIEPDAGCVRIEGRDTRELAPHVTVTVTVMVTVHGSRHPREGATHGLCGQRVGRVDRIATRGDARRNATDRVGLGHRRCARVRRRRR